jgi:hypothetical protein
MRYLQNSVFFGLFASLVLAGCSADVGEATGSEDVATSAEELGRGRAPTPPDPSLAVPEGNRFAFSFDAVGVQIYACQASGSGFAWVFQAPEATLYGRSGRSVGTHYVGPTWEYRDQSKVVAAKVAAFTPDPTAIPALLLQATTHEGDGLMAPVTYIQRLETTGGLAPSTGCDADHVTAVARVDYTATYYFYEAKKACQ